MTRMNKEFPVSVAIIKKAYKKTKMRPAQSVAISPDKTEGCAIGVLARYYCGAKNDGEAYDWFDAQYGAMACSGISMGFDGVPPKDAKKYKNTKMYKIGRKAAKELKLIKGR